MSFGYLVWASRWQYCSVREPVRAGRRWTTVRSGWLCPSQRLVSYARAVLIGVFGGILGNALLVDRLAQRDARWPADSAGQFRAMVSFVMPGTMNWSHLMNALVDEPAVSSPQHSHCALDDTLQDNPVEVALQEPHPLQVVT